MKVLQISPELNVGSVGKIAEQIGEAVMAEGWQSYIAYGREARASSSQVFRIGSDFDVYTHVAYTRLTDRHGFFSRQVTRRLVNRIKEIAPDIIHLQHIHGYYINIEILFEYLSRAGIPVVWTFHDCWSFTGHCAHYDFVNCRKWQTECKHCPQLNTYPASLWFDRSQSNYADKKKLFNSVPNLTIVPVSNWLAGEVRKSFLNENAIQTIHNGIDINQFAVRTSGLRSNYGLNDDDFIILGVAYQWDGRKGLNDFLHLSPLLKENEKIVLVGLNDAQIKKLPKNIIGLKRTKNVDELAQWYSTANVFVNPTLEDTFPTTNLESLACGTPVITYNTGGSPEAIDEHTGIIVDKNDLEALYRAIRKIKAKGKETYSSSCRERSLAHFDKKNCFSEYIRLYKKLLAKK